MVSYEHKVKNIYLGEPGWSPGENTVAYYPLTSTTTVNDMSGNSNNLTNNGVTFETVDGIGCAYIYKSNIVSDNTGTPNLQNTIGMSEKMTISIWVKFSQRTGYSVLRIFGQSKPNFFGVWTGGPDSGDKKICIGDFSTQKEIITQNINGVNEGTWVNYIVTKNGTNFVCYMNGVQVVTLGQMRTLSDIFTIGGVQGSGGGGNGYYSNVILESKARTAQEISDYFNGTKGNYGIQ